MDKYIYDENNGLWYELQGNYYIPCLLIPLNEPKMITNMKAPVSCKFNIDTACVELKKSNGSMIFIDTIAVENEYAETWLDRRELDYLIYNDPRGYADLILNGDVKQYLDTVRQGQ